MTLRFGTDGMRGDARSELLPGPVRALSRAAALVLGPTGFAVGRDTRQSGPDLTAAVHDGVAAAGGNSVDLGVVPTPAVARWCDRHDVAGAMISASHNPWHDNGVKFFAPGGVKLDDARQDDIQQRFEAFLAADGEPAAVATVVDQHEAAARDHVDAVVRSLDGRSLAGLRLVVDAANGAASAVAPAAFQTLGAAVTMLHDSPDGTNINAACGSTHPADLQAAVIAEKADLGIGFDGDADRLVAVDHAGALVDGDQIIAICALDAKRRGRLADDTVVVTVMTNLGFRRSMAAAGIEVVDTAVGDRHVLEALDRRGLSLGGEQSGHVIFRDLATTGDGLLSAVQLLDVVARSGRPLADLAATAMTRLPQVLVNVSLATRREDLSALLAPLAAAADTRLAGRGRVLLRPSGTEPLVRVMVEAETDAEAAMEADALAQAVAALTA